MPRDSRVNISVDNHTIERLRIASRSIGSTPAGVALMLIRWYLGDADQPPPRPAHKTITQEPPMPDDKMTAEDKARNAKAVAETQRREAEANANHKPDPDEPQGPHLKTGYGLTAG